MSLSTNTTYRVLVEKLGASDPSQFVGNEGEVFYDPSVPALKLSDGSTAGGLLISSGGGGGGGSIAGINTTGTSFFNELNISGISTFNDQVDIYSDVNVGGSIGIHTTILNSSFVISSAPEYSAELMCLDGPNNTNIYGLFAQYADETTITSRDGNNYGTIKLNQYNGSTVQTSIIIPPSGNIGIGTTNPQTKLEIGGVLGFSGEYGTPNIRIGDNTTGANLTTGQGNVFIGVGAGNSTTTGTGNHFFGIDAGRYNTVSDYNNFIGVDAGKFTTSGSHNNFLGSSAGQYNTTGNNNVFVGSFAGYYNTTGVRNNFIGAFAGYYNTTGNENSFFGNSAGSYNTTGYYNNFFGKYAGYSNTLGNHNTYIGSLSGLSTSASRKVILGSGSSYPGYFDAPAPDKDTQLAIGIRTDSNPANYWIVGNENFNIGIGTTNPQTKLEIGGTLGFSRSSFFAGEYSGTYRGTNISIGDSTTGGPNLTPFAGAYYNFGISNIFIGSYAGAATTSGYSNNFIGDGAGRYNTEGSRNNFIGDGAGYYNTTGYYNNFFGYGAGSCNTTGSNNNFFGVSAGGGSGGNPVTGSNNNFFGCWAGLQISDGHDNNFFGSGAGMRNTSGSHNNFFGKYSGCSNTTGNLNNFFGTNSGTFNITGSNNLYLGNGTGVSTASSGKVIIGLGDTIFVGANNFDAPAPDKDNQFAVGIRFSWQPASYWLVGDENFNVGIGTTNPTQRLEVQNGDIRVGVNTSNGVILTDANGVAWRLIVNTDGTLSTSAV